MSVTWTPVPIPIGLAILATEDGDEMMTEAGDFIVLDGIPLWSDETISSTLWTRVTPNPSSWTPVPIP